jgi:hypothetical protein
VVEEEERVSSHGGARSGAWRPRDHFDEHLASIGGAEVGADFRPPTGRIGPRTKNDV